MNSAALKIRKYYTVFTTSFQNQLIYRADLFAQNIFYALLLFIFINLWSKVFSAREFISGYTKNDLIWYFIITEIITLSTQSFYHNISAQIKGGNFAYSLNKPYGFLMYSFWENSGVIIYKLVTNSVIGIVMGSVFAGMLNMNALVHAPLILITVISGIMLHFLIQTCIALTALYVEDNIAFFWIYNKLVLIFGIMIPIDMFPGWLYDIVKYMPFSFVTFGPAKLVLNFSLDYFLHVLAWQSIYILMAGLASIIIFKKGVRKVSIHGG